MMGFDSIDKLHMHFSRELASWQITREEYDGINEMLKAVEEDVSKRIEESEAFAKRVQEAVENREDVTLFGVDYMPLPVDADGVPIHVGDVVEYVDGTLPKEVLAIVSPTMVVIDSGPRFADCCRHHHAQTIEDMLQEMLYRAHVYDKREMELLPDLIAEYAAKLQLTDDYTEHVRGK